MISTRLRIRFFQSLFQRRLRNWWVRHQSGRSSLLRTHWSTWWRMRTQEPNSERSSSVVMRTSTLGYPHFISSRTLADRGPVAQLTKTIKNRAINSKPVRANYNPREWNHSPLQENHYLWLRVKTTLHPKNRIESVPQATIKAKKSQIHSDTLLSSRVTSSPTQMKALDICKIRVHKTRRLKFIKIGEKWNEIEKSMLSRAKLIRCKNIKAHLSL